MVASPRGFGPKSAGRVHIYPGISAQQAVVPLQKILPKNFQGPFPVGHIVKFCLKTEDYCWTITILPVGQVSTWLVMS